MDERPYFGKEIIFQEDIERVLLALWVMMVEAAQVFGSEGAEASAFSEGCRATLVAVAMAFGCPPPSGCGRSGGSTFEEQ